MIHLSEKIKKFKEKIIETRWAEKYNFRLFEYIFFWCADFYFPFGHCRFIYSFFVCHLSHGNEFIFGCVLHIHHTRTHFCHEKCGKNWSNFQHHNVRYSSCHFTLRMTHHIYMRMQCMYTNWPNRRHIVESILYFIFNIFEHGSVAALIWILSQLKMWKIKENP